MSASTSSWLTNQTTLFNFFVIGIFVCILVVSVYTVSFGLGLKVYVTAADLTPERVAKVVNQTFDIISNVDEISSNAVPVSLEAKNVLVNGTNATIVSDAISRTYESFSALHKSDWKNLVTNFTSVRQCCKSQLLKRDEFPVRFSLPGNAGDYS
jgi:hypothetical protein